MQAEMPPTSLEHDADAPAAARRALDSVAAELSAEKLSDARILVNELVSNSVRHACPGVIELMLDLTPTHLVIAVTDAGAAAVPVIVQDGEDAAVPHGWGLRLVETLSESWGVRDDAPGRRTVWCEVRRVAAL
jgi:serine/threonine-protein kinase RsbW